MQKEITLQNGTKIILRHPILEDVDELTRYANILSSENTYITMSGEVFTREEELGYINRWLEEMAKGDRIQLFAFADNELVANAEVRRVTKSRTRSLHIGEIAISIAKGWRGQGLGREILKILIEEAKNTLKLRLVMLTVFANNTRALNLYTSLGFIRAGEMPGAIWYKGEYIGQVYLYLPLT